MAKNTKKKSPENYITNEELLPAVLEAKKLGRVTPKLGKMILLLVERYSEHRWWSGYSPNWLNEMKSEGIVALTRGILKFDPEYAVKQGKKPNVFAYSTTVLYRSFKSTRDKEKKHTALEEVLPDGMY